MNKPLHGYEVDAYFQDQGLVVEIDSYTYHRTRKAFENDRRRDIALQARGLRTIRFTDLRIADEPDAVGQDLKIAVDFAGPRSS
jgi:very-short-patch-repair endonuclease